MLGLIAVVMAAGSEEGWKLLFTSNTTEVDNYCISTRALPHYLNGSYLFAAIGQLEMGGQRFQDILDGYGKLHRFVLSSSSQKVCFTAKMMDTGFYNESVKKGGVAAGVLFSETIPPRHCILPMCNIRGPNDNVIINTLALGNDYMMVTDSPTTLDFDPASLHMRGLHKWTDSFTKRGNMGMLGSGHPLPWPQDAQNRLLNIVVEAPYIGGGPSSVDVVALRANTPAVRELIARYQVPKGYTPYFHSFGATPNYLVLPHQAVTTDFSTLERNLPMADAFRPYSVQEMQVVPLNGSKPITFQLPTTIAYAHNVNAYENGSGIVFDLTTFNTGNPFMNNFTDIATQMDKRARDAEKTRGSVDRYVLHLHGASRGHVTTQRLTATPQRYQEFPKINPEYQGRAYCIYYADEWYHDDVSKASTAVVKQNVCTGETQYWHRHGSYPLEAIFVPSNLAGGAEDDGVLLFVSVSDEDRTSHFHIVNATDLTDILDMPLPVLVPYQAHGQFFPGLFP